MCNNVATAKEMASIHFWPQAAVTAASTSSRKRLMLADTELSASIFEKVFFSINIIVLRPELGCIHTFIVYIVGLSSVSTNICRLFVSSGSLL